MNNNTSGLRTFWIIWCSAWAFGWFVIGFMTFFTAWFMVPISLIAILIPVGSRPPQPQRPLPPPPPACSNCGAPYYAHWQGQCPRQLTR